MTAAGPPHWLVFVARLRPGMRERARSLVEQGPPVPLEGTGFDAHEIFLSNREVVFVFESRDVPKPLELSGESPAVLHALRDWHELLEEGPLPAETVFAWRR